MTIFRGVLRTALVCGALVAGSSLLTGCGEPEEVETACCQLLLVCESCGCRDTEWTLAAAGEGKACRAVIAEVAGRNCESSTSATSQAQADCTS